MNDNVLSNYVFGETYFPHVAIPINRKAGDTIIFFESKQLIWKIEKQLKDKKKIANNLNVDSLMAVDAIDLIETFDSKYNFFLPDNVNEIRNMYYFGSLSTLGIQAFLTLKEASEYFNIGQDKVRQLTDEDDCEFVLFNGSKRLIKKKLMEEYLNRQFSI